MNSEKFAFACCEVDGDDKDCDLVFPLASAQDNITGFDQAPNQIPFFFSLGTQFSSQYAPEHVHRNQIKGRKTSSDQYHGKSYRLQAHPKLGARMEKLK